jgi:hypothetical protein
MKKFIHFFVTSLLGFLALNAFGGGYYGMAGAKDIPLEWLQGSPFNNYFMPSLILFIVVGGYFATASVLCFINHPLQHRATVLSALISLIWIAVQVAIIGYVSWMQPAVAASALLIILLSWISVRAVTEKTIMQA